MLDPVAADTLLIVPLALPVLVNAKSSAEMFTTDSLKFAVNAIAASPDPGVPLTTMPFTKGAMLSTMALVVSDVVVVLPALSLAETVTLRLDMSMAPAPMV
ncbi:hypothetical protein D3C81_1218960 [compost metagenome]